MKVYLEKEIREMDKQAEQQGFSLFTLMENAGCSLFEKIRVLLRQESKIAILCGRANNGGDGIVLARYLKLNGYHASLLFPLGEPKSATAKQHLAYYQNENYCVEKWKQTERFDVIIDCLLGVGVKLPLLPDVRKIILWANQQEALRIAIDLPTGVEADYGKVDSEVIFKADYTFALQGMKPSAFLLPSSIYYGKITTVSIGLSTESNINVTTSNQVRETFPKRTVASHKGTFGTSLIVAGNNEMPGSAMLAAIGAIRTGTGKLMIATTKHAASIIATSVPEATFMFDGLERISCGEIPTHIVTAAIGPGIANQSLAQVALDELMKLAIPLVVDAGALSIRKNWSGKGSVIITPHPGEFSRLTGKSVYEIQMNRIELAREFSIKNNIIVVLKGQYTVIAFPNGKVVINPTGNSGLAKGGSGDVLTGMIVSMLATHDNVEDAVINAVFIHGYCANKWTEIYSESSMVASDFNDLLPKVLKEFE